jgi:LysR family transcriptional regulator for bpeEF and oprC
VDTLAGIELFTATAAAGSFAAAARRLGVTPSAVSRRVAQLEAELGAPLFARTTRTLRLTDDGRAFNERCLRILEELREARDAIARTRGRPAGVVRVDAPIALGRDAIAPRVPALLAAYPELRLELTLRDQRVDAVAEGLDILVRIGDPGDSTLIGRKLATSYLTVCAAPAYLRRRGTPRTPADLARHDCLSYLREGRPAPWRFASAAGGQDVAVTGRYHANDAELLRACAIAGHGVVMVFDFLVRDAIAAGQLVPLLADHPSIAWPIHALYPRNRHLVPKVAVVLDHLAESFGAPPRPRRSGGRRALRASVAP